MPADVDTCAVYLAEDGSVGLAWAEGVCALTPMEAQMGQLSLAGKQLIFHDSKTAVHRLDELGIQAGECVFDTALAAYDLNPSSSDYTVSKLATNYLGPVSYTHLDVYKRQLRGSSISRTLGSITKALARATRCC